MPNNMLPWSSHTWMGQEALSGKGHLQDFLLTAAPGFSWHFLSLPLSSFRSEPRSASFAVLQNDRRHIRYTQLLRLQTYFIFPHPHLGCRLNFIFLYYVSETFRLQASCYFAINKKNNPFHASSHACFFNFLSPSESLSSLRVLV